MAHIFGYFSYVSIIRDTTYINHAVENSHKKDVLYTVKLFTLPRMLCFSGGAKDIFKYNRLLSLTGYKTVQYD